MRDKDYFLKFTVLALISILPLIIILILSFGALAILDIGRFEIMITYANMTISFGVIPFVCLKYFYPHVQLRDLGLKKPDSISMATVIMLIVIVYIIYVKKSDTSILFYAFQVLPVAITEELWARGIVYYICKDTLKKDFMAIVLSSLIFAFITHMDKPILENLIYRLPGALLLGYVFCKSKRLELPIAIHFLNNFIGGV